MGATNIVISIRSAKNSLFIFLHPQWQAQDMAPMLMLSAITENVTSFFTISIWKKTAVFLPTFHHHTRQALGRCMPSKPVRGYKVTDISFPLCVFQIFAYMDEAFSRREKWDLQALRFLSINPIIDPWVFAIFRPPVLRVLRSVLCCRVSLRTREAAPTSCSTQSQCQ